MTEDILSTDTALVINDTFDSEESSQTIKETEKLITNLKIINERIQFYIEEINLHANTTDENEQKKRKLYLSYLREFYQELPKFIKEQNLITNSYLTSFLDKIKVPLAVVGLCGGVVIRAAQRYFSVAVVSDSNLVNKTIDEQIQILATGMWGSLHVPANYLMAGLDTIFSYGLSYYPFGLKSVIDLFSSKQEEKKTIVEKYSPLESIIKYLEKSIKTKDEKKLISINPKLDILYTKLKEVEINHIIWNNFKDNFDEVVNYEYFQQILQQFENDSDMKKYLGELSDLTKTDLNKDDYSWSKTAENSWNNIKSWLITLALNHLIITLSSSWTAETLTWDEYQTKLIAPTNIVSTVARATFMTCVNNWLIKPSLNTIFDPIKYFSPNNNFNLMEKLKNKVNKQKKPVQVGIFVFSIIVTSLLTNLIKTFAADITQNKGDWEKAGIQFKRTFPTWQMVLISLGVTTSDIYNLTNKLKPALKLIYKEKEEQKIIDTVLSELLINRTITQSSDDTISNSSSIENSEHNNLPVANDVDNTTNSYAPEWNKKIHTTSNEYTVVEASKENGIANNGYYC